MISNILPFSSFRNFIRFSAISSSYNRQYFSLISEPQIIRATFPKALFKWSHCYRKIFFEIAWSFLASPNIVGNRKTWSLATKGLHRTGGLPAYICARFYETFQNCNKITSTTNSTYSTNDFVMMWYYCQKVHRVDRDITYNLTLPAVISQHVVEWRKHGKLHRKDRDGRTHFVLPAYYNKNGRFSWHKHGKLHRSDWDCATLSLFPAVVSCFEKQFHINGQIIA